MFKKLLLIVWVSVVGLSISCKGPEGAVGPAGEKGETGATGATGPAGTSGEGGGGAAIFSLGESTTEEGQLALSFDELTAEDEELFDATAVQVFVKSGGYWWPLPGRVEFDAGASAFSFVHGIEDASFFVILFTTGWTEEQDTAPERTFEDVRLVLIPGTVTNLRTNAQVNWKDYGQTISALGLTEANVQKGKFSVKKAYKGALLSKIIK